jgi:hypothetical protein
MNSWTKVTEVETLAVDTCLAGVIMADLTEEEYDALDEYYTKNPPQIDPLKKGTGFFTRRAAAARTITVDTLSAAYLTTKAIADHKTPADIIGEMVRERIAATVV